jgi:hypothetical protein
MMRRAKPEELQIRAVPIMTAQITERELRKWMPVPFERIDDPWAVREPSKAALIQLGSGAYVVVWYGETSQQLLLEIPETGVDGTQVLVDFFGEVPLPRSRVLWHRPDVVLPKKPRSGKREAQASATISRTKSKRSALEVRSPRDRK